MTESFVMPSPAPVSPRGRAVVCAVGLWKGLSAVRMGALALAFAIAAPAAAQKLPPLEEGVPLVDRDAYPTSTIVLEYAGSGPRPIDLSTLRDELILVGHNVLGLTSPARGIIEIFFTVDEIGRETFAPLYADAVETIGATLAIRFASVGIGDVVIAPNFEDVDPRTRLDLRSSRRRAPLRLAIWTGGRGEYDAAVAALPPPSERPRGLVAEVLPGPPYVVDDLVLAYGRSHPDHPPLSEIEDLEVRLGSRGNVLTSAGAGAEPRTMRISEVGKSGLLVAPEAIREINRAVVEEFNRRGLFGVLALPDPRDIDPRTNADLRPEDRNALRVYIWTGRVKDLRTLGFGERIPEKEFDNHPAHASIKSRSPLQPVGARGESDELLRLRELEEYLARLNRHPGRRVTSSIVEGRELGEVYVDYLVNEAKPWSIYARTGDEGTDRTSRYRQRVGFSHNQLTGADDILSIDFLTGGSSLSAASISYSRPIAGTESLRWTLFARGGTFDADFPPTAVGLPFSIEGDSYFGGAQLTGTLYQNRKFFLDWTLGARYVVARQDNGLAGIDARDTFFLPSLGLAAERRSDFSNLSASVELESNVASIAGTDVDSVDGNGRLDGAGGLGRPSPDEDWVVARWNASFSTYLEPILSPESFVEGSRTGTLANELVFRLWGQSAFGNRLIPQEQFVVGGASTVRGYEQSISVGDTVYGATFEYRLHLPRLLSIRPPRKLPLLGDFRVGPSQPGGRPDWDLVLRLFADAARVEISDPFAFELDQDLMSVGIGLELQAFRNLSIRADIGFPLDEGDMLDVDRGDPEVHFSITTLY